MQESGYNLRYLIVGDVHWSQYSSIVRKRGQKYSVRLEKLLDSLNWVENFGKENNCDKEIFLGDFYDRADLNAEEITAIQDVKWNDIDKTFLVGNHESNIANLDYSTTKLFESINARVINTPLTESASSTVNLNYIPYITCDGEEPLTKYIAETNKKNIIFAHQDIAGMQYGKFTSQSGFNVDDIRKNCALFIDGHLHNGYSFDNIVLVGNLTGQNFNEDAERYEHCVYILEVDGNNVSMTQYINPVAMNFAKIKIDTKKDITKLSNIKNNSVLSIVCNDSLKDQVETKLKTLQNKLLDYRLTVYYANTTSSEETYNFKVADHIQQFIDFARQKFESSPILDDELSRLR